MRLPSRLKLAEELLNEARKRRVQGLVTYGEFNPETDKRILSREAIFEAVDIINYLMFYAAKHRNCFFEDERGFLKKARQQVYELFVTLKHLEAIETKRKGGAS